MGSRRSKHNKGRKPFYKDHRSVAEHLLKNPKSGLGASWAWTRTHWTETEMFKLNILCEADSDVEGSADHLGRSPTSIARRARDFGIPLPRQWLRLITPKYKPKLRDTRVLLSYPYVSKARDEHSDLLAVNAIIPAGISDNMRADMCQEILLAILEGHTTLDALKEKSGSATYFIKKFYHDNYEAGGHAISFDDTEDGWNADDVASSIARKEWHQKEFAERTSAVDVYRTFTPPTQFEAAWQDQLGRLRIKYNDLGQFLSEEEIEELVSETQP